MEIVNIKNIIVEMKRRNKVNNPINLIEERIYLLEK